MIAVTGDIHGEAERLDAKPISQLKKGDTLIICGDFGFVWDDSAAEKKKLKKLEKKKYTILFIDGTHDNLDLLKNYPEEEWNGGLVRRVGRNILYLERGNIYTIEDRSFFVFGGGESTDLDQRTDGVSWWAEELPSPEELDFARNSLDQHDNQVDFIITHECNSKLRNSFVSGRDHSNSLIEFFNEIAKTVHFRKWYFGCYHRDQEIPPVYHALFQSVQIIEGTDHIKRGLFRK